MPILDSKAIDLYSKAFMEIRFFSHAQDDTCKGYAVIASVKHLREKLLQLTESRSSESYKNQSPLSKIV